MFGTIEYIAFGGFIFTGSLEHHFRDILDLLYGGLFKFCRYYIYNLFGYFLCVKISSVQAFKAPGDSHFDSVFIKVNNTAVPLNNLNRFFVLHLLFSCGFFLFFLFGGCSIFASSLA